MLTYLLIPRVMKIENYKFVEPESNLIQRAELFSYAHVGTSTYYIVRIAYIIRINYT